MSELTRASRPNARQPDLEAILVLCRRLQRSHSVQQVLITLLEDFAEVVGTSHVNLGLINGERGVTSVTQVTRVGNDWVLQHIADIPIEGDAMMEEVRQGDHVVVVRDARTDPRTHKPTVALYNIVTLVAVPLFPGSRRQGVLTALAFQDQSEPLDITPAHVLYMTAAGLYTAMALERLQYREAIAQSEAALYRVNELLRATLSGVSDGVFITDAVGRIEYINPGAERLCGLSGDAAVGRLLDDTLQLLDPSDFTALPSMVVGPAEAVHQARFVALRDGQGALQLVQAGGVPIADARGTLQGMVVVVRDVTAPARTPRLPQFHDDGDEAAPSPHARVLALQQRMSVDLLRSAPATQDKPPALTPRERECVSWCAAGKTAWETGQIIGISEWTVVYHLDRVKRRLGILRKQQLVERAISLGMIVPGEATGQIGPRRR